MIRLLKRMREKEILMCLTASVLLLAQVFFDLRLPDFMSGLTVLIQTPGSTVGAVCVTGGKMLLCTLCSAVLAVMCGYLSARIASGFTYAVRRDLFYHISRLGQQEMIGFSVPSLITRTTNDITQIQMAVAMGLQALVKAPVMAVWAVIKILGKSWELSAVTAGFLAAICLSVFLIVSSVIPRIRRVQKLTDKMNRIARENLTGISVVHAFNAEDYQDRKFQETNQEIWSNQLKNQRTFAALHPIMTIGMNGLALSIFWVGAALLTSGAAADMTRRITMFGDIMVFSSYATYVVMAFMMLVMIFMMLPAAQISAERINQVLLTEPSVREGSVTESPEEGTVEFRNVSFRYPGAADDELSDICFRVEKGRTLAVIGATGSGKTTLISLIARFYDATRGTVLVDSVDVRDYTFDALYDRLGFVTQKAVLFSGTVKDNIAFGESRGASDDEAVGRSLELARASGFVEETGRGAEAAVSQAGINFSGGQKQRLSIARALARDPEILIFDDSFSALDYKTDAALRRGLSGQLPEVTKIIVAQRISTIRHADKILVLENGAVVGDGTHDELMRTCSVYREIAASQLSGAEPAQNGSDSP